MLNGKVIVEAVLQNPDGMWTKEFPVQGVQDEDEEPLLQGALLRIRQEGLITYHPAEHSMENIPMARVLYTRARFEGAAITPGSLADLAALSKLPGRGHRH